MVGGWLIGRFVVDRLLNSYPWGSIGCLLLGAVAGFYEVVQILLADQREKDDQS